MSVRDSQKQGLSIPAFVLHVLVCALLTLGRCEHLLMLMYIITLGTVNM